MFKFCSKSYGSGLESLALEPLSEQQTVNFVKKHSFVREKFYFTSPSNGFPGDDNFGQFREPLCPEQLCG